jgi:hypothetical protein
MKTREDLDLRLRVKFFAHSDNDLMDKLQDIGLVSDEAVTIDDCADRDLIAAYQGETFSKNIALSS